MERKLLKFKWKLWEYILVVTEYLFGYSHEVSHTVKHKRNMAYIKCVFYKPKKERSDD